MTSCVYSSGVGQRQWVQPLGMRAGALSAVLSQPKHEEAATSCTPACVPCHSLHSCYSLMPPALPYPVPPPDVWLDLHSSWGHPFLRPRPLSYPGGVPCSSLADPSSHNSSHFAPCGVIDLQSSPCCMLLPCMSHVFPLACSVMLGLPTALKPGPPTHLPIQTPAHLHPTPLRNPLALPCIPAVTPSLTCPPRSRARSHRAGQDQRSSRPFVRPSDPPRR